MNNEREMNKEFFIYCILVIFIVFSLFFNFSIPFKIDLLIRLTTESMKNEWNLALFIEKNWNLNELWENGFINDFYVK